MGCGPNGRNVSRAGYSSVAIFELCREETMNALVSDAGGLGNGTLYIVSGEELEHLGPTMVRGT
jgi:hypothetical protein